MSVVLITGTSTGIGFEAALHLAREGHDVFAGARSLHKVQALRLAAEQEDLSIVPVELDVDADASVEAAVGAVLAEVGRIDVLVNNAGVSGDGPLEDVPVAVAKQIFETNYFGAIRMVRAVLPGMRERHSGCIVNVTSVGGRVTMAANGHYCASKFALEAASEVLALEVAGFGIRVALIEPGVVATPLFTKRVNESNPASPYATAVRRLDLFFSAQLKRPTSVQVVAKVIEHAITTDAPMLRYLVGEDAQVLVDARRGASDEAWIADAAGRDDDDFFGRMRTRYGREMFR